ncbi:MAG: aminoglycoside phosphotransferase family protein [Bdellovibrionales bacterium]
MQSAVKSQTGRVAPGAESFLPFITKAVNENDLNIIQLAGDASNRRYFRVAGVEHSWVLMVWEPFEDNSKYPFLSVLNHFARSDIHVPKVIGKAPEQGLVLLEDLGDLTLERRFWEAQDQKHALPLYEKAIDELVKIHYRATQDKHECTAFQISFDVEKLLWEMNYGRTHLIEGMSAIQLKPEEIKELDKIFLHICETLHNQPKFICHRDYHSRNLMLKFDKMRVIDFQDARMGPIHYDLVSLLKDSYVNLNDESSEHLLQYYFNQRREAGFKDLERNQFNEIYEIQSIQRCFKACGSFSSFWNTRQDKRYLKYIRPTLQRVKKSLAQFPKYQAFSDILEGYGLMEKDFEAP